MNATSSFHQRHDLENLSEMGSVLITSTSLSLRTGRPESLHKLYQRISVELYIQDPVISWEGRKRKRNKYGKEEEEEEEEEKEEGDDNFIEDTGVSYK